MTDKLIEQLRWITYLKDQEDWKNLHDALHALSIPTLLERLEAAERVIGFYAGPKEYEKMCGQKAREYLAKYRGE